MIEKNVLLLTNIAHQEEVVSLNEMHIQNELIRLKNSSDDAFQSALFINHEGDILDYRGNHYDVSDRRFFRQLREENVAYVVSDAVYGPLSNTPLFGIGVPIYSQNGIFLGAIGISMDLNYLSKITNKEVSGSSAYGWIIDSEGVVIAHPDNSLLLNATIDDFPNWGFIDFHDIAREMRNAKTGFGIYHDENLGEDKVITFSEIPNSPQWKLAISTLESEVFASIYKLIRNVLLTGMIIFIISMFLIYQMTKSTTQPIVELTNSVRNSIDRNFEPLKIKRTSDEVGQLVDAYNDMINEIAVYDYQVKRYTHELEVVVEERTKELYDLNKKLSAHNEQLSRDNDTLYDSATKDSLTGFFNRKQLDDFAKEIYQDVQSLRIKDYSVLFMDLDNFKYYNDTYGHDIGDKLLERVSTTLSKQIRSNDIIGRYGGDEFVLLLPEVSKKNAEKVRRKIEREFESIAGYKNELIRWLSKEVTVPHEYQLGISIGVAYCSNNYKGSWEDILKDADKEMYEVKKIRKLKV